jgi:putative spermidine/putrescine transport system substrate-binding protein
MRKRELAALVATAALVLAACGGGGAAKATPPASLGAGEGALNLVAWTNYVVGGTGGETVEGAPDWVTPFETATGCKVTVKVSGGSSDMVELMKTGQYDGVSASGDATLRLIAGGDVAPVNTDLIPNYKDVFAGLKGQSYNTVDGQAYGVPHGRGANLLMYRTDLVPESDVNNSWKVVWDGASKYKGKITAYDYEIYIADAAVYLMATKPDLKITNPYALDATQFKAAVDLLKEQRKNITTYWSAAQAEIDAFTSGDMVAGTTWQYQANVLEAAKVPIKAIKPKEGTTGWSDTWMISSKAKHPNCMYKWMDYIISPVANANVTVWFGEAPVSPQACAEAEKLSAGHCDTFHAADENYFKDVYYWNTPKKECLDGRGSICTEFSEWTKAWTEIKG